MTLKGNRLGGFLGLLLVTAVFSSCDTPTRKFNSLEWKSGDASIRGGMAQDIMDSQLLYGKLRIEIEGLLGKPDYQETDWYGYKVITIARCRFVWECRMGVVFDSSSNRVKSVAVSD
jgi:hypothetical protein